MNARLPGGGEPSLVTVSDLGDLIVGMAIKWSEGYAWQIESLGRVEGPAPLQLGLFTALFHTEWNRAGGQLEPADLETIQRRVEQLVSALLARDYRMSDHEIVGFMDGVSEALTRLSGPALAFAQSGTTGDNGAAIRLGVALAAFLGAREPVGALVAMECYLAFTAKGRAFMQLLDKVAIRR